MQLYSHILSLRISHPALDPDLVTHTLGLNPGTTWKAGDPCKTPRGAPLGGTRSNSYWAANPFGNDWRESSDETVENALEELVSLLEPHQDFLRNVAQGGRVEIWVSSHSNENFAVELVPQMLVRLGTLGVALVHDVYQGT